MEGGGGQRTRAGFARILRDFAAGDECENRDPAGTITSGHYTMFSWFKQAQPSKDTQVTRADLDDFEERITKAMRNLRLDWEETYDKFRILNMRVSKRVQREEELRAAEATTTEGETTEAPTVAPPRRMIIRSRILRR
jgi:hypothetical protein